MPAAKVAFITALGGRTDFIRSLAPDDLEVVLVDINLPDDEKIALCRDAQAVISSNVSVEVLRQCPNVKLIQTLSAGYDRLDIESIGEMGIPISNNGGANAIAVSEQTIALMIGISKRTMQHWDSAVRQRQWKEGIPRVDMFEITNKTVGIVGLGRIGKKRCQTPARGSIPTPSTTTCWTFPRRSRKTCTPGQFPSRNCCRSRTWCRCTCP